MFDKISTSISEFAGSSSAFIIAALLILVWALAGPFLDFSEAWQLTINTGTTIITFLMVFLIQHSQNKHTEAVQKKLDELIRSIDKADDNLIEVEKKP